jgi:type I restriction enzyme M protein
LQEANWLTEKFGTEGKYADIPGLCKIETIKEVEKKNWSLTPGAYVGVAEAEDDGVDFAERMHEIHAELLTLQQESNELMAKISANFKELGI